MNKLICLLILHALNFLSIVQNSSQRLIRTEHTLQAQEKGDDGSKNSVAAEAESSLLLNVLHPVKSLSSTSSLPVKTRAFSTSKVKAIPNQIPAEGEQSDLQETIDDSKAIATLAWQNALRRSCSDNCNGENEDVQKLRGSWIYWMA